MKALFGGGCFWGMEKLFVKEFSGIKKAKVGYAGGEIENPTYKQVCSGTTGHAEVIYLEYDPEETQYRSLVEYFYRIHDPTTLNRQGNDRGTQYRSVIFYYDEDDQEAIARDVTDSLQERWGGNISTEISPAPTFWEAEEYHQQYLKNNPGGYCNHRERW